MAEQQQEKANAVVVEEYELDDVRQRMREESKRIEQEQIENNTNPWLMAASYLTKKATEKVFGNSNNE